MSAKRRSVHIGVYSLLDRLLLALDALDLLEAELVKITLIKSVFLAPFILLFTASCSEGGKDDAGVPQKSLDSLFERFALPDDPTRPKGGVVNGRNNAIGPEENMARSQRNKRLPVVYGEGAAGITFETTFAKSLKILSDPLGEFQGFYFYAENIRVAWDDGESHRPELIVVDSGYKGPITMPESLGAVYMGSDMSQYFTQADPEGEALIVTLAKFFEGLSDDFDCLAFNICQIVVSQEFIEFQFRNGGILFNNDAAKGIEIMYFGPKPPPLTTPLTGPIVFGESVAGITMDNNYDEGRAVLGPPISINGLTYFYDNGNLGIAWDFQDPFKPLLVLIERGYQGPMTLPAPFGEFRLGNSMASYFPENDQFGEEFLVDLGRIFDGQEGDANYDCRLVNSCGIIVTADFIEFAFDKGGLLFDNDANRDLALIYFTPPPPARTPPLTDALNFDDDAAAGVGGVTMGTNYTAATAILGEPRGTSGDGSAYFYDNDNLVIIWDEEESDPGLKLPVYIQVNAGYRGALNYPAGRYMNEDFDTDFGNDQGQTLIKAIANGFRNEADCLTANTCSIEEDGNLIFFLFEGAGFYAFSNDGFKTLRFVGFDPEQTVPEPED